MRTFSNESLECTAKHNTKTFESGYEIALKRSYPSCPAVSIRLSKYGLPLMFTETVKLSKTWKKSNINKNICLLLEHTPLETNYWFYGIANMFFPQRRHQQRHILY